MYSRIDMLADEAGEVESKLGSDMLAVDVANDLDESLGLLVRTVVDKFVGAWLVGVCYCGASFARV
jgi:hypothetical protein